MLGSLESRLERLRANWRKALQKASRGEREAALRDLLLPNKSLDRAVPNLSSIIVLVEVGGRLILLTGDAHGDDVVTAWAELGLEEGPVALIS